MESTDLSGLLEAVLPLLSYFGWQGMAVGLVILVVYWLGRRLWSALPPASSTQDGKPWPPKDHKDFWDDMANRR